MRYDKLPASVLAKLVEFDEQAEFFNRRVEDTERGIAAARTRLTGGFRKDQEYHDLRRTLDQMIADKPVLETNHHRTQRTLSACKEWLDELPEDAQLEVVNVKPDGHDLTDVRERIKDAEEELERLRALPTPASDIRKRVQGYVHSLAKLKISGIGKGETLKVTWPDDILALFALLFPERVQEVVLAEVERVANEPLPIKERHARIAKLECEIDELAYLEEALVVASGAERSPDALPQAVLGVRALEATRVTRAV